MSFAPETEWLAANQRHLTAAVDSVRRRLERHAARVRGDAPADPELAPVMAADDAPAWTLETPPALVTLCSAFSLSSFERDVLLLCAGIELDAAFVPLCAAAHADPRRAYPTFSLALAALHGAHWSALTPTAPLRRWRLVELGTGAGLARAPLRIDERVLHYLTGVSYTDERLAGIVSHVEHAGDLVMSHAALVDAIAAAWTRNADQPRVPVIQVCGEDAAARAAIAAAACAALGLRLSQVSAAALPPTPADRDALLRLWEREAVLDARALLLECDDQDAAQASYPDAALQMIEQLRAPLFVSGRERRHGTHRSSVTFDVPRPAPAERRVAWRRALGAVAPALNGHVDLLVSQFALGAPAIHEVTAEVLELSRDPSSRDLPARLWDACRLRARPRMDDLAQRIDSTAEWEDLVLPAPQCETLREIVAHVRQRATVYEAWGFGAKGTRGLGISALFAGASGTGKTLAAEVLARELQLDLYRIDLSSVVSKYIGETEKNLRHVFDAAEEGGAILLFDEADALFGKRSEVKDSHDRYANIEVSYLLQRMEAYRGLAILTTNLKSALDPAFLRRIRFVVPFPFPDAPQRAEIWRRIFPRETPTDGLDVGNLARLNVAGGNIRNIALNAAFLAADAGEPVRMPHLLQAARSEYSKLEKPLTDAEIGGWEPVLVSERPAVR